MPTKPDCLKSSPSRTRLLSWTLSVLLHLALLYGLYWFATVLIWQQDPSKPFQVILQATLAQSPAPEHGEQAKSQASTTNPAKTSPASSLPSTKAVPKRPPESDSAISPNNPSNSIAKKTKPKPAPTNTEDSSKPKPQAQSNPDTKTETKTETTNIATTKTATSNAANTSPNSTNTSQALQAAQPPDTSTVLQPPVCSGPKPTYPRLSRLRGETGQVRILIWVSPDSGAIQELEVLQSSGFTRLDQAALVAVRRWRCQAAELAGKPHSGTVEQSFDFGLLD